MTLSLAPGPVTVPAVVPSLDVAGVRIDMLTPAEAVESVMMAGGRGRAIHLCNAYTISLAVRDASFRAVVNRGQINLPDGTPLTWLARAAGMDFVEKRVYGPDLMRDTLDRGRSVGLRHYLYGTTPDQLRVLRDRLELAHPGVVIVGAESPPFGPISDTELEASIGRMEASRADVVWVALGTPKQDEVVERMAAMGSHTYVAVGAAFDFLAGNKRQAPPWVQDRGLEWLFRLATEPRRLWKRYLVGNVVFLAGTRRQWTAALSRA